MAPETNVHTIVELCLAGVITPKELFPDHAWTWLDGDLEDLIKSWLMSQGFEMCSNWSQTCSWEASKAGHSSSSFDIRSHLALSG